MGRRARWWRRGAALLAAVVLLAACVTTMDEGAARTAALRFYVGLQREPGAQVRNVEVTAARPVTRDGRAGWEVTIDGTIAVPAAPQGYANPMILFVDDATGAITVIAQG